MRLRIETEGQDPPAELPGNGEALIAFMSFAVSRGFGAVHPLIALADRLHDQFGVRLGPLTTFYEEEAEDDEDREKLELAWQEAEPLQACLDAVVGALKSDEQCQALVRRGNAEDLAAQATAARDLLAAAAANGWRVRLVYAL